MNRERADDETVKQLISEWDFGNFQRTQKANKALAAMGGKAVPALTALINENHRHSGYAIQTLADMGAAARPAQPALLKLARNKAARDPDKWTWNMPIRAILFLNMKKMSWGSEAFVPLLAKVGQDEQETDQIRGIAVRSLQGMGPEALPVLRRFMASDKPTLRESAVGAIVEIQSKAGMKKADSLQEIIDAHPFDSNVPTYLANMKGIYNQGKIHPPSQRVKKLYREELAKKADPQIAWQLATIIRNGLAATDLMWASPSDSYRSRSLREDPDESYETLAQVLDAVLSASESGSELWKKAGLSLARLRLLQGDWESMNAVLERIGHEPVPLEQRPVLTAPPFDWQNLGKDWQLADKSMRSGNCGIEFRFLRRGQRLQGVHGVHVLVKLRPEPQAGFMTGIKVDTLFHATQPLMQRPFDPFGYRANDRKLTRYAVSNKNGVVRIENLPNKPIAVEILVPTANFAERGYEWDLMMATSEGVKIADRSDRRSVDANKPPALVELKEGQTVRYPLVFVRSQLMTDIADWEAVDKDSFVLNWTGPKEMDVDHYNVNLILSAPAQENRNASRSPVVAQQTVKVTEASWPLGERGVGDLQLIPGNIYMVEVEAIQDGAVVAALPRQRVWVPWEHRESTPPQSGFNARPAFYSDIWLRTNVNGKSLEDRLPRLIRDSANMFETEYHRLGMAWLDLHKNKPEGAEQLRKLIDELPEGNVVKTTAQSLLNTSKKGEQIPKRFKFVAR